MVSGSSTRSCHESGSATGNSGRPAECNTSDSGRGSSSSSTGSGKESSSSSSSEESSCCGKNASNEGSRSGKSSNNESSGSSKLSSRESSAARLLSRGNCLLESGFCPLKELSPAVKDPQQPPSKPRQQNLQQHQGRQQHHHAKCQKMQHQQEPQQRRPQHRKQQQGEKEGGSSSAADAWMAFPAGGSRACTERKPLILKSAGSPGGISIPCDSPGLRKEASTTAAEESVHATETKVSPSIIATNVQSRRGSAAAAVATGPPAKTKSLKLGESGRPLPGGARVPNNEASAANVAVDTGVAVAAGDGALTGRPSAAAFAAEVLPLTAAAARPAPAATGAGKRYFPALSGGAAATADPRGLGLAGKVGVCLRGSAAVEQKKGKAPRRAPWCKSALLAGPQKQHASQQQRDSEQREHYQAQQADRMQQQRPHQPRQPQQGGRTSVDTIAEQLHVDLPSPSGEDVPAADKETEIENAQNNASVHNAARDSDTIRPSADVLPTVGTDGDTGATTAAGCAASNAVAAPRSIQTAVEGVQAKDQETHAGDVPAEARNYAGQGGHEKAPLAAAPPREGRPDRVPAAPGSADSVGAKGMHVQRSRMTEESGKGLYSVLNAQLPAGCSNKSAVATSINASALVKTAGAELPAAFKGAQHSRPAEATTCMLHPTGENSKAEEQPQQQQLEHGDQGHAHGCVRRTSDCSSALTKEGATAWYADGSAKAELDASSRVAAPRGTHAASVGYGRSMPCTEGAPAPQVAAGDAGPASSVCSRATPSSPVAAGRRTFAAAAAAAAAPQEGSKNKNRIETVPPRHIPQGPQQHAPPEKTWEWGSSRAPGLSAEPATEGSNEQLRSRHQVAVPQASYLASLGATSDGVHPRRCADIATINTAAAPAGSTARGVSALPSSAAAVSVLPAVPRAAVSAAACTRFLRCEGGNGERELGPASQQLRKPRAAANRWRGEEQPRREPFTADLRAENNKGQAEQHQQQHDEGNEDDEVKDRGQPCGQSSPSDSRQYLPPALQPQQAVAMQQRLCVQHIRSHEGAKEETKEVLPADKKVRHQDERGEEEGRSPSTDKREATEGDDALSIPLTSTILADRRSVFYKTQLCPHAVRGRCRLDEHCNFAHSRRELRPPPRLDKTKICASIKAGIVCPNGQRCLFAHNREELRHSVAFYKTNMCRSWISGACMHPHTCNHAHGMRELFFFRTLAAVAGCRDFRRERHGVAAAVAAASTPSKAASIAAALDSLRRRLAAAPPAAATVRARAAQGTYAAGGQKSGDAVGAGGGGRRNSAAAPARAATGPAEMRGSSSVATAAAAGTFGAGVPPLENGGERHAYQNSVKGTDRQRRSTSKADAEAKSSGRSSESTLTLDSGSSKHQYSDGGCSSSCTSRECTSSSVTLCASSSSIGNSNAFDVCSSRREQELAARSARNNTGGTGGAQQRSNIPQQRSKPLSSRAGGAERLRSGQRTNNAGQPQQPKHRHAEHLRTSHNNEQEGKVDDLVALIPLLPAKEREVAELLLMYIDASAADKDDAASLILSLPPELIADVGGGEAGDDALAAAQEPDRGAGEDARNNTLPPIGSSAEVHDRICAASAEGQWTNAEGAERGPAAGEPRGKTASLSEMQASAGAAAENGRVGDSGALRALGEPEGAEERSAGGSRARVEAPCAATSNVRALPTARCDSEAATCWGGRTAAEGRALSRRRDVQNQQRTQSRRWCLAEREGPSAAVTDAVHAGGQQQQQQHQQQQHTVAPAARRTEVIASAELETSGTDAQLTCGKAGVHTVQKPHAPQQWEQLQHQLKRQQQFRDSFSPARVKADASTKARPTGKRCGKKNAASALLEGGCLLHIEPRVPLLQPWGTLQSQTETFSVQQGQNGDGGRLEGAFSSSPKAGPSPRAAATAGQQQEQHQQRRDARGSYVQQLLFTAGPVLTCKKRSHQSWAAAAAAANAEDGVKHRAAPAPVAFARTTDEAAASAGRADTTGGLRHSSGVPSPFVLVHVSQEVQERQRQQLLPQQQQQGTLPPVQRHESSRNAQPWRLREPPLVQQEREKQQPLARTEAELPRSTPVFPAREFAHGTAVSPGKGPAANREERHCIEETSARPREFSARGRPEQAASVEKATLCRGSGASQLALPRSPCSAAPAAADIVRSNDVGQQADQRARTLHLQLEQEQQQQQQHRPSLPVPFPTLAAAVLWNREDAAATAREQVVVQELQLHDRQRRDEQRGAPEGQEQRWERGTWRSTQKQGSARSRDEGSQARSRMGEICSPTCLVDTTRHAPQQQQHPQLQPPVEAAGFVLSDAGARGGEATSAAWELVDNFKVINVPHWGPQGREHPSLRQQEAEAEGGLQEQQWRQTPCVQEPEQHQFQHQPHGGAQADYLQDEGGTTTGVQLQRQCSGTPSFEVPADQVLWRLFSETNGALCAAGIDRELQRQQREREFRAAIKACRDSDGKEKARMEHSFLRGAAVGTARLSAPAPPALPVSPTAAAAHNSAHAEQGFSVFPLSSESGPTSPAAPLHASSAAAAATESAAGKPEAPTSLPADSLAAVRGAAAVLAAAAAGAVGTPAPRATAPADPTDAASAAAALLQRSLVGSAFNAAAAAVNAGDSGRASRPAAEGRLPQQLGPAHTGEEQEKAETAADAAAAAAVASVMSFLTPLEGEETTVLDETEPQHALRLDVAQQLAKESGKRVGELGRAGQAKPLEDAWACASSAGTDVSRDIERSGQRNENDALLRQLLAEHQDVLSSSTDSCLLEKENTVHSSSTELVFTMPPALPAAPSGVSPSTPHLSAATSDAAAAAAASHEASTGIEVTRRMWSADAAAESSLVQHLVDAEGDHDYQRQLLLLPGCKNAWGSTGTPAEAKGGQGAGSCEAGARFAGGTAEDVTTCARNVITAAARGLRTEGEGIAASGSTHQTTAVRTLREGAIVDEVCQEQYGAWRRRAKSFGGSASPTATAAGWTGRALALGARRRATTTEVVEDEGAEGKGESAASDHAGNARSLGMAERRLRTRAGDKETQTSCNCRAADAAHAAVEGSTTRAGAASGSTDASVRQSAIPALRARDSAACNADRRGTATDLESSTLPISPLGTWASLTSGSSSFLTHSSSHDHVLRASQETVGPRPSPANHDEELLPPRTGAPAVAGASPAWSYSASTAAASDDCMEGRVVVLPKTRLVLDRWSREEREGLAHSKTLEGHKAYQGRAVSERFTGRLVNGKDFSKSAQQQLLSNTYRQQHTQEQRQREQQRQQPDPQPQRQQMDEYFLGELLKTTPPGGQLAARTSASPKETMVKENGNSGAQPQQQLDDGLATTHLTPLHMKQHKGSASNADSSCPDNSSNDTSGGITSRYENACSRSSSDSVGIKEDVRLQLHSEDNHSTFPYGSNSYTARTRLDVCWSSGQRVDLYNSSCSGSRSLFLNSSSSSTSKCSSNNSNHGAEKLVSDEFLQSRGLRDSTGTVLQVNAANNKVSRDLFDGDFLSHHAVDAIEVGGKKKTPELALFTESDTNFSAFRTVQRPLYDASKVEEACWNQHHRPLATAETTAEENKCLQHDSPSLQHQRPVELPSLAALGADSCRLRQLRTRSRDEARGCCDVATAAVDAACDEEVCRPRSDSHFSARRERAGGSQQCSVQLQRGCGGGRTTLPFVRDDSSMQPVRPISTQGGICTETPHQHGDAHSQTGAVAEPPILSSSCETASIQDSKASSTLQSSMAMMNAVVLIERMMNELGLES